MNMEITIAKTFCDFRHNVFKKTAIFFWPFYIRILAINYEKSLATLSRTSKLNHYVQAVKSEDFFSIMKKQYIYKMKNLLVW